MKCCKRCKEFRENPNAKDILREGIIREMIHIKKCMVGPPKSVVPVNTQDILHEIVGCCQLGLGAKGNCKYGLKIISRIGVYLAQIDNRTLESLELELMAMSDNKERI